MDSIMLSTGSTVTRLAERDSDGYFYIEMKNQNVCVTAKLQKFRLKENNKGKCEIHGYFTKDDETEYLPILVKMDDARLLLDFLLKRKLRRFTVKELEQFQASDEYKNGFFGDEFVIWNNEEDHRDWGMYEYEEAPVKTTKELEREAENEKIEAERIAKAEQAQQEAILLGLPELKGTEKQVRWAEQLRNDYFKKTIEHNLASRCKSIKTAKWWIEKRFELGIVEKKEKNQWGYYS